MIKKLRILIVSFMLMFICICINIVLVNNNSDVTMAISNTGKYTLYSDKVYPSIYDCNFNRLNNKTEQYYAVVLPESSSVLSALPYVEDKQSFLNSIERRMPFLCKINYSEYNACNNIVLKSTIRTDENMLAPHIIGYRNDGVGVCGLEKSYNDFLTETSTCDSITFNIDAVGNILNGSSYQVVKGKEIKSGVVTTIDSKIQEICVYSSSSIEKGAIMVMDVKTGEIKACVSLPEYDPTRVADYLNNENSPLINRCFCDYNVGSIFKLLIAGVALESGISPDYTYICKGSQSVYDVNFNCHYWQGHGEIDMRTAIKESCNTYFINLVQYLDNDKLIETANKIGFGKETELAPYIVSNSGSLQSKNDLLIPAEKANMSFGQGKLTATPLQICLLTSTIVNNGMTPEPVLVKGFINSEGEFCSCCEYKSHKSFSTQTSDYLKSFMVDTVRNETSLAKPLLISAGGKTSTAQTGIYNENGNEISISWFSGFFPIDDPKYVVTILVENGQSGNKDCGPVFSEIADKISKLYR